MDINIVDEMVSVLLEKQRCEFHYAPTDKKEVDEVVKILANKGYQVNATYHKLGTPNASVIITIRKVV